MAKSKVTGIDVEVKSKKIALTLDEAQELCNALSEMFGKDKVFPDGEGGWMWDKPTGVITDTWDSAGSSYTADFIKATGHVTLKV